MIVTIYLNVATIKISWVLSFDDELFMMAPVQGTSRFMVSSRGV